MKRLTKWSANNLLQSSVAVTLLLCGIARFPQVAQAQDASKRPPSTAPKPTDPAVAPPAAGATPPVYSVQLPVVLTGSPLGPGNPVIATPVTQWPAALSADEQARVKLHQQLHQARLGLSTAKSDKEKLKAQQTTQTTLVELFDADLKSRRGEVDRLTKHADELSTKLTKRADQRDQLISLQLKAIELGAALPEASMGLQFNTVTVDPFAGSAKPDATGLTKPPAVTAIPRPMGPNPVIFPQQSVFGSSPETLAFQPTPRDRVNFAMHELEKAKSDNNAEATAKATGALKTALETYFDEDLEARRKELTAIKAQLEKLSGTVKKREAAKDEILDLQLKLLTQEADGLGFFTNTTNPTSMITGNSIYGTTALSGNQSSPVTPIYVYGQPGARIATPSSQVDPVVLKKVYEDLVRESRVVAELATKANVSEDERKAAQKAYTDAEQALLKLLNLAPTYPNVPNPNFSVNPVQR